MTPHIYPHMNPHKAHKTHAGTPHTPAQNAHIPIGVCVMCGVCVCAGGGVQ